MSSGVVLARIIIAPVLGPKLRIISTVISRVANRAVLAAAVSAAVVLVHGTVAMMRIIALYLPVGNMTSRRYRLVFNFNTKSKMPMPHKLTNHRYEMP